MWIMRVSLVPLKVRKNLQNIVLSRRRDEVGLMTAKGNYAII